MTFADLADAQILGLTGAAEARSVLVPGQGWVPAPAANMIAVMCTPVNRIWANPARFGHTVSDACLEREQYSCWNPGSTNHVWLQSQVDAFLTSLYVAPIVEQCVTWAQQLIEGTLADTVNGSTHYYSPVSMVPDGHVPMWARGLIPERMILGPTGAVEFAFFKGVR